MKTSIRTNLVKLTLAIIFNHYNGALLLLAGLICFSCSNSYPSRSELNFKENKVFSSGFKSTNAQIESFGGKEYICFGDAIDEKQIVIHPIEDNEASTFIDISRLNLFNERMLAYEVINLDTILILPYQSNILYFMNKEGHVWNFIDLNPYLQTKGNFELKRSGTPFQYKDATLIFSLEYLRDGEKEQDIETYRKNRNAAPALLRIENIFKDSLHVTFGLNNLYSNFSDALHANIEGNNFNFVNDQIVFNSAYSDSLYVIDPIELKIKQKVKINSNYSDLKIKPITNLEQALNPDLINQNFSTNGQIKSVKYSAEMQTYFVFVSHKPANNIAYWSIIVLDNDFHKLDEYLMDPSKYAYYGMTYSKGLMVSNYYETAQDISLFDCNTYALFDFK